MERKIIRVGLAQLNLAVGDLKGNSKKIIESIKEAENKKADIICFSELSITGYPPEDLLLRKKFIDDNQKKLEEIIKNTKDIVAIVGFVDKKDKSLYNAAAIIHRNKIVKKYYKECLPNYSVFDERRYFSSNSEECNIIINKIPISVTICEDIWVDNGPFEKSKNSQLLFNLSASPFYKGKHKERREVISSKAKNNNISIIYVNAVGGQDEIVFDGNSLLVEKNGQISASLPQFKEELVFFDVEVDSKNELSSKIEFPEKSEVELKLTKSKLLSDEEEIYEALKLGLKDYVEKNGFNEVVVGLSGGIDSALTATIAADALGPEKVNVVLMPSRYTSNESVEYAKKLSKNLGVKQIEISIDDIYQSYLTTLKGTINVDDVGITLQNVQARIRGNVLMALSNKFGYLVLATGNKSELSVGYATLYGDMAGGFALLKDIYKTYVYKLAKYRNSSKEVIPKEIIMRKPSAELKPGQLDTDSLPSYDILDPILKAYIEEDKSTEEIAVLGNDSKIVKKVIKMVDSSEYKRRQAAPGIKITPKAFGKDRRMPITNMY